MNLLNLVDAFKFFTFLIKEHFTIKGHHLEQRQQIRYEVEEKFDRTEYMSKLYQKVNFVKRYQILLSF